MKVLCYDSEKYQVRDTHLLILNCYMTKKMLRKRQLNLIYIIKIMYALY